MKKNKAIITIVALVVAAIAIIAIVLATTKDNANVINDVSLTITLDGKSIEGELKDNEVQVNGSSFGEDGTLTLNAIEDMGYSVNYSSVGTEIKVVINSPATANGDDVDTPAPTNSVTPPTATVVPEPTPSVEPEKPIPSENTEVTETPKVSANPEEPQISQKPEPTPVVPTQTPEETKNPVVTQPPVTPAPVTPVETPKPENTPAPIETQKPTTSDKVPTSDTEGKKAGTTTLDASDVNNLYPDNEGNYNVNIQFQPEGTAIVSDLLTYIPGASTDDNITNFVNAMTSLDTGIFFSGNTISYLGQDGPSIAVYNGMWDISANYWGANFTKSGNDRQGSKYSRTLMLNTLRYFGDANMANAVYGMLDEHYRFRSDNTVPISDELAAKYGLTIASNLSGTIDVATVSDGVNSWTVAYNLDNEIQDSSVTIKIPIR